MPVLLRTEMQDGDLVNIIQVVSPAKVTLSRGPDELHGVLLDIDSIYHIKYEGDKAWEEMDGNLDSTHLSLKNIFFNLLSEETVKQLDPVYAGEKDDCNRSGN